MGEAAHLPEAEASFNIASPVATQIIAVSSVAPGWFTSDKQETEEISKWRS